MGLSFMGKAWDHGIPGVEFWQAALRVAKPGAYLVAFGGTRTYHRLTCAIEDAGWEIRDCLSWLYGSGFPKSHNGPWGGTALKPAWEPIVLARKPLAGTVAANVEAHGTGALNIDGCRINPGEVIPGGGGLRGGLRGGSSSRHDGWQRPSHASGTATESHASGRWPANVALDEEAAAALDAQSGTLTSGANPTRRGGLGYHGARGQEEAFAPRGVDVGGASRFFYTTKASRAERNAGLDGMPEREQSAAWGDLGAVEGNPRKPSTGHVSRTRNHHPTVKPLDLMQWLCRLVTPKGGVILDPFTGSGSTGRAAVAEGFSFIGIELSDEYAAIARARIAEYAPLLGGVA